MLQAIINSNTGRATATPTPEASSVASSLPPKPTTILIKTILKVTIMGTKNVENYEKTSNKDLCKLLNKAISTQGTCGRQVI